MPLPGRRRFAYLQIVAAAFYECYWEAAKVYIFVFIDDFNVSSFIYR